MNDPLAKVKTTSVIPPQSTTRSMRFWKYAFLLLIAINVIVIGRDLIPKIQRRLARREMANNLNDQEYWTRVLTKARGQLASNEFVPIDDETRLLILDDLRNLRTNALAYSWPHAMLAKGIMAADVLYPDEKNVNLLRQYYDGIISPTGNWQKLDKLDQAMHGPVVLYLADKTKHNRYVQIADEFASYLIKRSEAEGGTVAYYDNVRLVDTLGMICPFLAEYGHRFDSPKASELAIRQIVDYLKNGIDAKSGLVFHGYNSTDSNRPVGVVGWGRGAGWYGVGLVDTLPWLDKTHRDRPLFIEGLKNLAVTLRHYQRNDGGWDALINVDTPYDSSATAMLTYVLQQGIRQGVLDTDYSREVALAMDSVKKHTRMDGTVDFAQGNLMSLTRHSTQFNTAPYAQGMVLATLAIIKYPESRNKQAPLDIRNQ